LLPSLLRLELLLLQSSSVSACIQHLGFTYTFEQQTLDLPMRRHQMMIYSLGLFAMGIACQFYSVFYPNEPYMQQMSFMFVAMPSVLAIINHYYCQDLPLSTHQQPLLDARSHLEEKQTNSPNTGSLSGHSHKHVLNNNNNTLPNHVATTSQKQRSRATNVLSDFSCNDDDGTELQFGEFN
jgi:amino acid permease